MTAAAFLASLPRDPARAIAQLDGALDPRWVHELAPEDRQALVTRRAELAKAGAKNV